MGAIETGTVWLGEEWEPIPGTFLEVRGLVTPRDLDELDYIVDYGFSPDPIPTRTHGLKLSKHGRIIVDVTITPQSRNALGVVADVTHLNFGVISVRFGFETPPAPHKAKPVQAAPDFAAPAPAGFYDWAQGVAGRWEDMTEAERDEARKGTEAERFAVPAGAAPSDAWAALEAENEDEWPDWLKALKAEGFDTEDLRAVLDEEDGYTPKSGRAFVLDEEDLDDEQEMSPSELQKYLARKSEEGR